MTTLTNLPFTLNELKESLSKGHVSIRQHPADNLYIFNYTPLAQYSRQWDMVTKTCRGLILDDDYKIVARPFQKIFNYTEIVPDQVIFQQPPVVTNKLDGSLGILYYGKQGWQIATRGSFASDQAQWATEWFNKKFPSYDQPENVTLLFEIIYPENRICVNYGNRAELVLIAAINNVTGSDIPLQSIGWWHGSIVEPVLGHTDIDAIYRHATSHEFDNHEGVVATWYKYCQPSFRLKVKHPEYVRLHGIITNFSKRKVWESLAKDGDFLTLINKVPDEFYDKVKSTITDFYADFSELEYNAQQEFKTIEHLKNNRKEFAEAAKKTRLPAVMFKMLDARPYDDILWNILKPTGNDTDEG